MLIPDHVAPSMVELIELLGRNGSLTIRRPLKLDYATANSWTPPARPATVRIRTEDGRLLWERTERPDGEPEDGSENGQAA